MEAADWKDGVITLLEPDSPYRPWRYAFGDSRPGDYSVMVLGTDPVSVLTLLGRIDHEGGLGGALFNDHWVGSSNLVDLATLAMVLDLDDAFTTWRFTDDDAERVILALHESRARGGPFLRWGHSSVSAARILLNFNGKCDSCDEEIDLRGIDARDRMHIHTADPLPRPTPHSPIRPVDHPGRYRPYRASLRDEVRDWPAVLCRRCHVRMRNGNFSSFIDFRFAQHPECRECGGARTQRIAYGEPVSPDYFGPWVYLGGCVEGADDWHCDNCEHEWS
ncbi:hypothetical protein [Mycolicibacterium diernhoferi]|uniref:hypothetical protein n=1 Tax=Mycolicibacterium diernhoferi TaxID=1801 RepID=UPI001F35183C|nr:hypothetical protein [Mycolicibacterium diernhoferi]